MREIDMTVLPIGPAAPPWPDKGKFTPETAARAAKQINAARIIPIHYGTFIFGDEEAEELLERFKTEADSLGIGGRIVPIETGQTISF